MAGRTIDVAIIGSGFAGLAAAIEAGNNLPPNAQVVVFEKMPTPGGNSIFNAGQIAAVGSKYQARSGIQDSVKRMMDDMLKAGINLNHPELLDTMINKSNETLEWTELELNIKYRDRVSQLGGHSVPRTLSTLNASGRDIIQPMLEKIRLMHNVRVELNSKFEGYILGAKAGKCQILGVRIGSGAEAPGEEAAPPTSVFCRYGVVLAAGGFSADVKFRSIQEVFLVIASSSAAGEVSRKKEEGSTSSTAQTSPETQDDDNQSIMSIMSSLSDYTSDENKVRVIGRNPLPRTAQSQDNLNSYPVNKGNTESNTSSIVSHLEEAQYVARRKKRLQFLRAHRTTRMSSLSVSTVDEDSCASKNDKLEGLRASRMVRESQLRDLIDHTKASSPRPSLVEPDVYNDMRDELLAAYQLIHRQGKELEEIKAANSAESNLSKDTGDCENKSGEEENSAAIRQLTTQLSQIETERALGDLELRNRITNEATAYQNTIDHWKRKNSDWKNRFDSAWEDHQAQIDYLKAEAVLLKERASEAEQDVASFKTETKDLQAAVDRRSRPGRFSWSGRAGRV
jgi:hypothetical protein